MAMAFSIISVVSALAGSFVQYSAMQAQADQQEAIARYNQNEKNIQANREQAAGMARAELETRKAQRVAGRAKASLAESGGDTTSGSPLLLEQDILKEGAYRGSIEIADAQNKERTLREQGKVDLYEGKMRANASRSQASASLLSGFGNAFSSLGKVAFG